MNRERAVPGGVRVCGGELRPPVLLHGAGEGAPHRRQRRRARNPEFIPHSPRVCLARWLYDAGEDKAAERVVADRVEPEPGIRSLEDLPQHPRPDNRRSRRPRRRRRVIDSRSSCSCPFSWARSRPARRAARRRGPSRGAPRWSAFRDACARSAPRSRPTRCAASARTGPTEQSRQPPLVRNTRTKNPGKSRLGRPPHAKSAACDTIQA